MRKIPTAFVRDWDGDRRYVTRTPNPECGWVFDGQGRPTRKFDGTCVRYDGERWWARREVKPGKGRPPGFVEIVHDEQTGKTVGWEPAEQSGFQRFLAEAIDAGSWEPGTYELVGPKINGNPEGLDHHALVRHGAEDLGDVPRDYAGLAAWLRAHPWEGVVWHHPDGRMAKLKRRDLPPA
ncbi:DUF5565 family protein [Actinoallomurus spadix]|uniref:Uncharacterized protein n=1 Tax=Actinoallomurus spadix TaxID=79912 RepID=A0ABP3GTT8_9ACTN|nr:DUF5565 family protein [Actinoallomurus spadix]MCO5989536.1 DUF5565 family protein [Actinoallomurus spadix]